MITFDELKHQSASLGESSDCVVKAVTAISGKPYDTIWLMFDEAGRIPGKGTEYSTVVEVLNKLNIKCININEPRNKKTGFRFTPKTVGQAYPKGKYLCQTKGHIFALIDGKVIDWTAGRKHRIIYIRQIEE